MHLVSPAHTPPAQLGTLYGDHARWQRRDDRRWPTTPPVCAISKADQSGCIANNSDHFVLDSISSSRGFHQGSHSSCNGAANEAAV